MFAYYLELAVRSLRRSSGLTALMMLTIGFGVAASMTMHAVVRGLSADPIPGKSSQLFVPQIDSFGPGDRFHAEPPDALNYTDAMALMRQHRAVRQSAIYPIGPSVMPTDTSRNRNPITLDGYAVYSEFFPMLDVPFQYGQDWSAQDDAARLPVAVISDKLNRHVFGGGNSVGKTIDIDNHDYRIVGVTRNWNPQPRFFDLEGGYYSSDGGPEVFLSFPHSVAIHMINSGADFCRKGMHDPQGDFVGLQHSDCVWIAYLAELDNAAAVERYRQYLDDYASDQQKAGRYHWASNNRLRDVPEFLDYEHLVPSNIRVSQLVAIGLLNVCLMNTMGLLLAKFLRRSGEIGIRRALGASRTAIHAQFLIEAGVIGVGGGVLGLLLTAVGVFCMGQVLPSAYVERAHIDMSLLMLTLLTAVIATLLAGLYPTFRATRVPPAWHLKSQ